ncbi:MAG: hypothetical protein JWO71_1310 [Candidatus Acidoferrum typicum]|nr:hypothetical protein [Candidatus Acidoferrum typicum]
MATLNIELSKKGVDRVRAGSETVSGSADVGELIKASALPLRLLNDAVVDHFNGKAPTEGTETANEPEVWVATSIDGEYELPRKINVQTAKLPRDIFDGPPGWFVSAVQQQFDDGTWADLDKPFSREQLLENQTPEFVAQHQKTTTEELNEMARAPFCTQLEEEAVRVFTNFVSSNRLFDHMGWIETKKGSDVLISEPYGGDMKDFQDLRAICDQFGWSFTVTGVSGYFPSATLRIEVNPEL